MRPRTLALPLAALLALGAALAPPAAAAAPVPGTRALLVLYPGPGAGVLDRLAAHRTLALGLVSATQGRYSQTQALLDLTSGARVAPSLYEPRRPPPLRFVARGGQGSVRGWAAAVRRAAGAPADIRPGLLAAAASGGAGYAGLAGARSGTEAIAAAGRDGRVPAVSLGSAATLAARARALLAARRLVVVGLPAGDAGARVLDRLLAARQAGELLIAMRAPPVSRRAQLLPVGVAGLGGAGALTSDTTRQGGLTAMIDLAPTILARLGRPIPDSLAGEPIRVRGVRDPGGLRALAARLAVIDGRRMPALWAFALVWLGLVLALGAWRDRPGVRWGMRLGGLAFAWLPAVVLASALPAPSRTGEIALVCGLSFALAALCDRLVAWPRAPVVPAAVGLLAYGVDLAGGSELTVRSLLGPNPASGSRFYGVGNELEIALALLFLVGLAAGLPWRTRSRRAAAAFALGGLLVGAWIAAGPLGADVGGVLTVGAGTAVAVLLLLPAGAGRRAVALAALAPLAGLGLLALIDTLAGGGGHFTRSVLHSHGLAELEQTVGRRLQLAGHALVDGLTPLTTTIALLAAAYGLRFRRRIYAPLDGDPVWQAGLGGGLAAAVVGSLANDSGPLLLIVGVAGLAAITAYLRGVHGPGPPPPARAREAASPATAPGAPVAP